MQEFAEGTNPRVYNKHGWDYVAAFLKGFMGGDFIRDTQDSTVMAGQLIGSFVPFIDVRDVVANTIHVDPGMTGLSLIGLIPVFGDATGSAGKCVKYVSQYADNPSVVLELLTFLEKNYPDIAKEVAKSDDFIPAMEKLAKSDLSKLTKAEREALEKLYEKNGLKSLLKGTMDSVEKLDDLLLNPKKLAGVSGAELYEYLIKNGYDVKPLSKGHYGGIPFEDGGGFKVNWGGDRILQYHPSEASHHGGAYYKISSGKTGTIRVDMDGNLIE